MKKIFAVLLSVLMLTLLLAACAGDGLVGTWILDDSDWHNEVIFSSDMKYWSVVYDIYGNLIFIQEGTYSISGNEITLQVNDYQDTHPFRIDGNTLDIGGIMFSHVSSNQTPPELPAPQASVESVDVITGFIEMEDGGLITFDLYHDIAPQSVRNFVYLARQGFYDGLRFHRIIRGFMIQGGCPDATGMGNPGHYIFGEFADNGFENNLSHTRGVMSMARGSDYNSAGSQFFICHGNPTHLDGGYAAFGIVTGGMDVVDRIAAIPSEPGSGAVVFELMPVIRAITIDGDAELPEPEKLAR